MIIVKLVDRLRVFTGMVLLALALILGGCGGNEAQEEQQDVQEEQEDVQEDLEQEQQDVEQEKQEIKEEQQDEEK